MKLTKLQLVQRALSAIDAENVTSFSDSVEAEQIALIVDTVYENIVLKKPWPHLYTTTSLYVTPVSNEMEIPDNVLQIDWVRYNGKMLDYVEYEYMREVLDKNKTKDNADSNGALIDRDPSMWASLGSSTIIFDAYNGSLQESLSLCKAIIEPQAIREETDIPDLPSRFFPALLYGVLSETFLQLKGDDSMGGYYLSRYKDHMMRLQRWADRVNITPRYDNNINYGRQGHFSGRELTRNLNER